MICDECKRYRGMKDGMVRCWDSQLMILTSIPIPSLKKKKKCPKTMTREAEKAKERQI